MVLFIDADSLNHVTLISNQFNQQMAHPIDLTRTKILKQSLRGLDPKYVKINMAATKIKF